MESRRMVGKYSQCTFAGASIGVVAPAFKTWAVAFWDNLAASMQLHHIPNVIAMNNRDCGAAKIAYGADKVANPDRDRDAQGRADGIKKKAGRRETAQLAGRTRPARRQGGDVFVVSNPSPEREGSAERSEPTGGVTSPPHPTR
jgi:hypothetical protein